MRDGFININKAKDMTSHDVVNIVRKIMQTKKVGHAGTLDPFATGVLPVAFGRATKFIDYLADCDKSYRAEILFGIETDTGDITGNIINRTDFTMPSTKTIETNLNSFIGTIEQVPPKYSAIKINGRKAYELARKNIEFTLPSRSVTVYDISIVNVTDNTLTIDVECSKGTYIRSLAVDIGVQMNTSATLNNLQRSRVGDFFVSEAMTLDKLQEVGDNSIVEVDACLKHLPKFNLPAHRVRAFCNGLSTRVNKNLADELIFRVYADDEFVGLGKVIDGEIKSVKLYKKEM